MIYILEFWWFFFEFYMFCCKFDCCSVFECVYFIDYCFGFVGKVIVMFLWFLCVNIGNMDFDEWDIDV